MRSRSDAAEAEVRDGRAAGRAEPGVAFLAPLDPFVWDRALLRLFGFDYVWEVYVPQAKRRWGYYVLPILFGDRLVGRIEPRIERREGVLRVVGLWFEDGFEPLAEPAFVPAQRRPPRSRRIRRRRPDRAARTARHRPVVGAVSSCCWVGERRSEADSTISHLLQLPALSRTDAELACPVREPADRSSRSSSSATTSTSRRRGGAGPGSSGTRR